MKTNLASMCSPRRRSTFLAAAIAIFVQIAAVSVFAGPPIGIGVGSVNDYSGEIVFADAMKQSRQWDATHLDANGWPQQDAGIYVWADTAPNFDTSGTYALSFEGQADVAGAALTGKTYDPSTNVTTGTITLGPTSTLFLTFTNTRRTADSALNTGVANVKLMRPTEVGASTSYSPGTTFTTQAKALYLKFGVLRFMDWLETNGNPSVNWSDRTRPGWATQFRWNGDIWSSRPMGAAWEYAVQLCNETGADMWINIPVGATDDYITKVAQLIANGSDGVLPYASAQANPVYAPLASGRKVYIEFSNEVWNTASPFPQSGTNKDAAVAEVNGGNSPLNFDGAAGEWDWAARRSAKRTVEISNIFRGIFGDDAMMTRIRPVLESQQGYTGWWLYQQSRMMEDYYNSAAHVATPHPPTYYVYGGGGSAYYGPENGDDTLTIDSIWASGTNDVTTWAAICRTESAYALSLYGRRVAYEGGPSMDSCGCAGDAAKIAAWSDPRMTTSVTDHQATWQQTGGDLLVYYTAVHDYQWGFTRNVYTLDTPKLQAVDQIDASTPAAGTNGTPIPGTIAGGSFAAPETFGVNRNALSADGAAGSTWLSYLVRNSTAGEFSIALSAGSVGAGNQADIYIDGELIGTANVPATGSNTTPVTTTAVTIANLPAGTHGLKVKAKAGTFGVQSVFVTNGSVADLPGAPGQLAAVASDGKVTLSWSAANNASTYNIYRGTVSGGQDTTPIATAVATNSYVDEGLSNGTTYFYTVASVNDHGVGPQSNEASATPAAAGIGPQVITSIKFYPRPGDFGWRMQGGRFEASNDNETWTTLVSLVDVWPPNDTWTTLAVSNSTPWRYVRFVSVNVNPWEAFNVAEIEFYHGATKLIGTAFGSPGSYQNDPATTFDKAFDGDLTTFVDNVPGAFAGYDFGAGGGIEPPSGLGPQVITSIKFYPRQGDWAWRMQGGRFEASNDYVTWTTLVSLVDVWPPNDTWTTLAVTNSSAWRYVRFVNSDVNSWEAFNVAEIEFYHGTTKLVGTAFGSPGSYQNDPATTFDKAFDDDITTFVDNVPGTFAGLDFGAGSGGGTPPPATPIDLTADAGDAQVSLSWSASDGATGYDVKRSTAASGPFSTLTNVASTSYTDTGLTNGTTYHYVIAATNEGGSSADSASVSATPVQPNVAPTITQQPAAKAATVGDSVSFTVQAGGYPAPTYQWRKDGSPIQGHSSATTATLTLASITSADAGNYDVVVTNLVGSAQSDTAALTVNKAAAVILLSKFEQRYDGTPRPVEVATIPAGLAVTVTYNNSTTVPTYPGAYAVVAAIDDPDFAGSAEDTLLITSTSLVRHAPALNGRLDGSAQVLLPESTTLNGGARVSGDLLIAGLPTVKLNGNPNYGGTIDADGAAMPAVHKVTLNDGSALRHVVRRVDAIPMPVVAQPPSPVGTRDVTLNNASQTPGDFATLRSLTLNSSAGVRTIPPGSYGTLAANGSSGFVFGVAGSIAPSVYNLQNLTLNGDTQLQVVGPVVLNLKNALMLNGTLGTAAHPEWLELNLASGGVTLNRNASLSGAVVAPSGTVTINGTLKGSLVSDRLTINGNGLLQDGLPPGATPGAPGALQATAGHGEVTLSWGAAVGATSYQLYRSTHADGLGVTQIAADITGTSYTDSNLTNGTTYRYWVVAANTYGVGPLTAAAAATPVAPPTIIGTNFWNKNWGTGPSDYFKSGVDWNTVTNPWRDDFLAQIGVYSVLRFMDWVPTNSSPVRTWSERVLKNADQTTTAGVAYEWQIDLCNRVGADIWITVPHLTIEDYEANPANNYWTQLAHLIKDNLNPNLNVWLEYSNESWSGGTNFNQGDYTGQRGVAMGFDADAYSAKFQFHVYAATRLDKVFLDVFAGQEYRIKKLIAGQANSFWDADKNWGAFMSITALNNPAINVFGIVPDYYTVTSYVGGDLDGASPNLVSEWNASVQTTTALAQRVRNTFAQYYPTKPNLPLVAYEGGSHILNHSDLFRENPLSYDMYKTWLNSTEGMFDLVMQYTHVGVWDNGGAWGAKSTTSQPLSEAHSYRALIDYIETGN